MSQLIHVKNVNELQLDTVVCNGFIDSQFYTISFLFLSQIFIRIWEVTSNCCSQINVAE